MLPDFHSLMTLPEKRRKAPIKGSFQRAQKVIDSKSIRKAGVITRNATSNAISSEGPARYQHDTKHRYINFKKKCT